MVCLQGYVLVSAEEWRYVGYWNPTWCICKKWWTCLYAQLWNKGANRFALLRCSFCTLCAVYHETCEHCMMITFHGSVYTENAWSDMWKCGCLYRCGSVCDICHIYSGGGVNTLAACLCREQWHMDQPFTVHFLSSYISFGYCLCKLRCT